MSNLNGKEIDFFYKKLTARDFEVCSLCQKTPFELNVDKLEIHETKYERPLKVEHMKLMHYEYEHRLESIDCHCKQMWLVPNLHGLQDIHHKTSNTKK